MANVYAISAGNWSNPAIWNTGSLPTSSDDVFSNGLIVQVNVTTQVLSVRNTTAAGIVAGGTFNLTNGCNLTCTAATGVYVGSVTPTITFALAGGNIATVNATIPAIPTIATYTAVLLNGLGTLRFYGDISCGPTSTTNVRVINITAAGRLEYSGVCTNGGNTSNQTNSIISTALATIIIDTIGFAGGNIAAATNASVYLAAGGTLEITGPITGGNSPAVVMVGGSVTVTGNVTAGSSAAITNITTSAVITVTGLITASSTTNAIIGLGLVKLFGAVTNTNIINANRFDGVYSPQLTIESTTTSWAFQNQAGTVITLYGSGASLGNPNESDVRFGTTYGPSNTLTGSCRIPNPNTVLLGALTDNTTGTLIMTPDEFIEELGVNSRDIAVRLQNTSTVTTTGDQIVSYNI